MKVATFKPGVQRTTNRALQLLVILSAGGLLSLNWIGHRKLNLNLYGFHAAEERDTERNERSTPRSFVLPATPAVALVQEKMKSSGANQIRLSRCVSVLRTLGYKIDGDDSVLDAKVVEAIYTFQTERHLPATGKVDESTMRVLKCR